MLWLFVCFVLCVLEPLGCVFCDVCARTPVFQSSAPQTFESSVLRRIVCFVMCVLEPPGCASFVLCVLAPLMFKPQPLEPLNPAFFVALCVL